MDLALHPEVTLTANVRSRLSPTPTQGERPICYAFVLLQLMGAYCVGGATSLDLEDLINTVEHGEDKKGVAHNVTLALLKVRDAGGVNVKGGTHKVKPFGVHDLDVNMANQQIRDRLENHGPFYGTFCILNGDLYDYDGRNHKILKRARLFTKEELRTLYFKQLDVLEADPTMPRWIEYHAVFVIQYDTLVYEDGKTEDFLWIQNTWGPEWGGLGGFARIQPNLIYDWIGIDGTEVIPPGGVATTH